MTSTKMSSVFLFLVVSLFVLINFTDFACSLDCSHGYRVNSGDTCWSTAQKCGITLQTLFHHNGLTGGGNNCNNLQPGHFLCCTNWNGRRK